MQRIILASPLISSISAIPMGIWGRIVQCTRPSVVRLRRKSLFGSACYAQVLIFRVGFVTEILSAAVVFFLIMDPLGNIPLFMSVLRGVDRSKHFRITVRELLIAYVALLLYLFCGRYILEFLQLTQEAISISGGIILFIIAIRMIFPSPHGVMGGSPDGEPFIVPLAIPAVAGPSIMAVLMLMSTTTPIMDLLIAITGAWIAASAILLAATPMHRILGQRGLIAIERLMGMILVMMSVQMMLNALASFNF